MSPDRSWKLADSDPDYTLDSEELDWSGGLCVESAWPGRNCSFALGLAEGVVLQRRGANRGERGDLDDRAGVRKQNPRTQPVGPTG